MEDKERIRKDRQLYALAFALGMVFPIIYFGILQWPMIDAIMQAATRALYHH